MGAGPRGTVVVPLHVVVETLNEAKRVGERTRTAPPEKNLNWLSVVSIPISPSTDGVKVAEIPEMTARAMVTIAVQVEVEPLTAPVLLILKRVVVAADVDEPIANKVL